MAEASAGCRTDASTDRADCGAARPVGVVVGASNVSRGIGRVVAAAATALGGRADLHVAAGRGRSFGLDSRVVVRTLPSVLASSLWRTLEATPVAHALITDVGNDLMYGQSPDTVLAWVDAAAARLRAHGARLTLVRLPMFRLRRLHPFGYECMRALLFPRHVRFSWAEALRRAECVDQGLAELACRHGASVVVPEEVWYGVDPIHIRRAAAAAAWQHIFAAWTVAPGAVRAPHATVVPWWPHLRLACALPAGAGFAGVHVRGAISVRGMSVTQEVQVWVH
jgi:hypothetical protein